MSSCLLNGTILGVTFGTGRGGKQVTPKLVPFSVSVLAVVTNKVETPLCDPFSTDVCSYGFRPGGQIKLPSLYGEGAKR